MNVNDQWMLERMQQMAASMASSVPQTSQNDTAKTEKGDSFKDLMDKAKDQKVDNTTRKDTTTQKTQTTENVQKTEPRKAVTVKNADGTETKTVNLTAEEAALVAAGYAALSPVMPDGTVWLAIPVGDGMVSNPAVDRILLNQAANGAERNLSALLVDGHWVIEPDSDLKTALVDVLQQMNDPRSADDIVDSLKATFQDAMDQMKTKVAVQEPEMEQTGDQEEDDNLNAEVSTDSQTLFKDVKAAPIKVGENFQLDTQQADMDEQLADTIEQAAQQGLKQIEIKLSPENLGALTIKLTQSSDGTLQVILHAANGKAANLLTQHLDGLNAALQGYSQHSEVQVQVQRGEEGQQAQQQQHQADADGHNRQNQQQQHRQQDEDRSEDFIQRLRLGLFGLEDVL